MLLILVSYKHSNAKDDDYSSHMDTCPHLQMVLHITTTHSINWNSKGGGWCMNSYKRRALNEKTQKEKVLFWALNWAFPRRNICSSIKLYEKDIQTLYMDKEIPVSTPMVNRSFNIEKDAFRPCDDIENRSRNTLYEGYWWAYVSWKL